jgi:hypothetical protein
MKHFATPRLRRRGFAVLHATRSYRDRRPLYEIRGSSGAAACKLSMFRA